MDIKAALLNLEVNFKFWQEMEESDYEMCKKNVDQNLVYSGKKAPTYRAFVRVLYSIVVLNLFIFNAQHSLSPNPWMPGKVNQPHLQCLIPIKTLIETLHLCLSWPLSCYIFYTMSIIKKKNILHNELIINEHATNLYILLKINIYPFKNENFID